MHGETVKFT